MKTLFLGILLSLGASAFAQPTLFNNCVNVRVNSVPGGNGVYFSRDCKTAYVVPPLNGDLRIDTILPNVNLRQCGVMNSFLDVKTQQAARVADISRRLKDLQTPPSDNSDGGDGGLFPNAPNRGASDDSALEAQLKKAIADAQEINDQLDKSLQNFQGMEGLTAQINVTVDMNTLVQAYQKKNPNIHFEPLTQSQARLNFVRKSIGNQLTTNGVLSTTVAGITTMPGFPSIDGQPDSLLFGGALSGQVVLSMYGACPFYDAAQNRMKTTTIGAKEYAGQLTASVTYVYNLEVNRSYHAEFNLKNFLSRLQTSESHGGLFTTSTVNSLIVEKDSSNWFKWTSNSQDGRMDFDEELRETVKASMIDRLFKQIVLLNGGTIETAPGLTTPKANGAQVGADNLRKCPYVYCQIGAAVLDVANAIFGGTSEVSNYINNQTGWSVEDASDDKMLPFLGTVKFGTN